MKWNYLSIPKLRRCSRWNLGLGKYFHPTHYWACHYLSMLGLRLIHVSKKGACYLASIAVSIFIADDNDSTNLDLCITRQKLKTPFIKWTHLQYDKLLQNKQHFQKKLCYLLSYSLSQTQQPLMIKETSIWNSNTKTSMFRKLCLMISFLII